MEINLTQLVQTGLNTFPLTHSMFDKLVCLKRFPLQAASYKDKADYLQIFHFRELFRYTIFLMENDGVIFFSPGGSPRRRFMIWFNEHYWNVYQKSYPIDVNPERLHSFNSMVLNFYLSGEFTINEIAFVHNENVIIKQGGMLTPLGRHFLLSIPPLKLIKDKVHFVH